jgi:hypothetical protein
MAILVVTRRRFRDVAPTDGLFATALQLIEQATGLARNLAVDALADADNIWWTATSSPANASRGFPPPVVSYAV